MMRIQRRVDRRRRVHPHDAAVAVVAAAVRVMPRAGRRVAAGDDVAHVEAAPGQAGEVAAVVEGEVGGGGDVVG